MSIIEIRIPSRSSTIPIAHDLPAVVPVPAPAPPEMSSLDGSTPKRDERTINLQGHNAERPSSRGKSANSNKKRKASDMEETGDIYNASHIHSSIKQEPGFPINDSQGSSDSTSPCTIPLKQEPNTEDVPPEPKSNSGKDTPRSPPRLDASLPVVKEEANSPDHYSREANDIQDDIESSDSANADAWNVSGSEFHVSQAEEDSSDDESAGPAFPLGMERTEIGEPNETSRGPDNVHGEGSNPISSTEGTAQGQESISSKQPNEVTASGATSTEHENPTGNTLDNHANNAEIESSKIPENGPTGRHDKTTVTGKPRKRAPPKQKVSARDISRSWKTANPADKMLMKMKEKGCDWLEIRKAWQELTGEWPAPSTLPNRYKRIRDNLTRMKSGDVRVYILLLAFLALFWELLAMEPLKFMCSKFVLQKFAYVLRFVYERALYQFNSRTFAIVN